ncbi:hypothetical protein H5410_002023 [Solanum commersonii]|uniref:Uncharacterized protein n=1 Tax=Solanum commersonii TaxID=4109 RepID=A0A9J6B166_SOLCO|nr:hypothetical protein H5410_002023 [Solanum commersonii]
MVLFTCKSEPKPDFTTMECNDPPVPIIKQCSETLSTTANRLKTADPGWKYGKRTSETNRVAVECNFYKKVTNSGIFRHKQHLIGTCKDVTRCEQCSNAVREEMNKYVDEKKEQKRQALL